MNMKSMQKSAIKPIPAAKNFNTPQKLSLFSKLFGSAYQKIIQNLREENQELILMNQRKITN